MCNIPCGNVMPVNIKDSTCNVGIPLEHASWKLKYIDAWKSLFSPTLSIGWEYQQLHLGYHKMRQTLTHKAHRYRCSVLLPAACENILSNLEHEDTMEFNSPHADNKIENLINFTTDAISPFPTEWSLERAGRYPNNAICMPRHSVLCIFLNIVSTTAAYFFDITSIFHHSWPAVPDENCSSCPRPVDSLKETSALASSSLPKSCFINCDFVPCVILSISAALVRDFRASSVYSSSLQSEKRSIYVSL